MFREYDIRGRISDRELNPTTVELIGKGFGTMLHRRGIRDVVVGYDSRESSPGFRDAMIAGLLATGRNAVDVGMVLTPVLYWAQHALDVPGGVMITASHNPPEWNGLKLSTEPSTTLLRPEIEELLDIVNREDFVTGTGMVRSQSVKDAYLDDVLGRVKLARPMRITVDAGNATPGAWAPDVYRAAGCDVSCLFCDIDPSFPNHFPNPSELENMRDLQRKVVEDGAEVGFAFDGDGDRLGVVDGTGKVVYADRVLMLLARQVLARHPGAKIVFDVKCSQALVDDIKAHGGVPIMWITGHSYMRAKILEEKAALGGERSGHIAFPPDWEHPDEKPGPDYYYGIDDGLFAGLRLLEYLSRQSQSLHDLIAEADPYLTSPEIQVECPDTRKYQIVEELVAEFKREYDDVIDINGARVTMEGGWGLVRASSNLPVLVLVFEAKTPETMRHIKAVFREKLEAHGCAGPWMNDTDD